MATEKLHGVVFEDDVGLGVGAQVNISNGSVIQSCFLLLQLGEILSKIMIHELFLSSMTKDFMKICVFPKLG